MTFTAKEKIAVAVGYVLFMILFYFIGIPGHRSFLGYAVPFLVVSAFYAFGVYFVKKFLVK
jgi:hypothetical protein